MRYYWDCVFFNEKWGSVSIVSNGYVKHHGLLRLLRLSFNFNKSKFGWSQLRIFVSCGRYFLDRYFGRVQTASFTLGFLRYSFLAEIPPDSVHDENQINSICASSFSKRKKLRIRVSCRKGFVWVLNNCLRLSIWTNSLARSAYSICYETDWVTFEPFQFTDRERNG